VTSIDGQATLPDPAFPGGWGGPRYSTGLHELDERLGGVGTGEMWVVAGAPGQGRSMLLTQLARRLACEHEVPTWLSSNRDPAVVVSGRLHAATARVSLNHIADDRITEDDRNRLDHARALLAAAQLRVVDGSRAADRMIDDLNWRRRRGPVAVLLDDPNWRSQWELQRARELADRGAAVVVSIPRSRVCDGPAYQSDLLQDASLADIVIEVRHVDLAAAEVDPRYDQSGYAALAVLRNRRGPVGTALVAFQGHYARFVDISSPGEHPTERDRDAPTNGA
jgi:replicative DNA helicase